MIHNNSGVVNKVDNTNKFINILDAPESKNNLEIPKPINIEDNYIKIKSNLNEKDNLFPNPQKANASSILIRERSVLSSDVWISTAIVSYDPSWGDDVHIYIMKRPLCKFTNIFIDIGRIYFVAKDPKQGSIDLYDCCLSAPDGRPDLKKCTKSVHFSFCFCFHLYKYSPAVATKNQIDFFAKDPSINIPGNVWVMHHWSLWKHPDHLAMKVLELLALYDNRNHPEALKTCCYSSMPDKIDALFSMDYLFTNLTDYELFHMVLLSRSMGYTVPIHSLCTDPIFHWSTLYGHGGALYASIQMEPFCDYIEYIKNDSDFYKNINCSIIRENPSYPKLKFVHIDFAFMSPVYKNNIPEPTALSVEALGKSLNTFISIPKSESFNVAIVQRNEGNGKRKFTNIDDAMRSINQILKVENINIWYIDSNTPAFEQVRYFRTFDLLISPHSSQLANLVFSRPGSHVIEIQTKNPVEEERTFYRLGLKMGIHYQFLFENEPVNRRADDIDDWRKWDTKINMTYFNEALENVSKMIKKSKP